MTRRLPSFLLAAVLGVLATGVRAADQKPAHRFIYTGDADLAPFDYLDPDGRPTGFNVDLVRALAKDAGVEVEIRLGEWNQARGDFDAGRADLISLSFSEERARTYLWLARTWTVNQSLLFRTRPGAYPRNLSELGGESIAVQERSLAAEMLLALPPPQPSVINVSTQAETLRLLQGGAVTAVGGGSLVLRVAAAHMGMRDFVELPLRAVPYGLVTAKGRAVELGWVPASLAHLRDAGTLDSLAEKYLVAPNPPRPWWDYRLWIPLIAVVLLAVAGAWFWNRTLVRRVKERTREMEEAMKRGEGLMRSLSANELRFQAFMALSSEGIVRIELDEPLATFRPREEQIQHIVRNARIAECNEAFARMVQRPGPGQLVGRLISEVTLSPSEAEETARLVVEGGYRLVNRELRRSRPDGKARWINASMTGVVDGAFLKSLWITQQDITARKEAEESLRVRGRIMEAVAFSSSALLEPGSWQEHVPSVLARLGQAVGVGCAYIAENIETPGEALRCRVSHEWTVPGVPALTREPAFQNFVWPESGPLRDALSQRQTVASLVSTLNQPGRDLLGGLGLKALLVVPIFVRDRWWGLLGFGDFQNERIWLDAEVEAIKIAGASLGAALLRAQVEEAVRVSEKKHRDIVSFAPEGIYQATREGTLVMANQEFARLLGYERSDELIGVNLARSVYHDPAERERLIAAHADAGHAPRVEVRLKRRDGSLFWAEMSAHAIEDAAGQFLFFEGFVQDITQRKAAEDDLRASEERYRLLFDGNPVPMLAYDVETLAILAANEAAVAQYGYSRKELLGLSLADLASPADTEFAPFVERRMRPRPELVRLGIRPQRRKDGSTVEVDITSLSLSFAGRPARLLLNRNVTEERRAEAERERLGLALERAAEEWHRTFDAVDVAILVLDYSGSLTRINRPALDMLGGAYTDVLAHSLGDFEASEPWRSAARMVQSVLKTRERAAARAVDTEAGKTWELTAYLAEAGQGGEERIILIVRDISRLVALQESLRRSETMSAMGSLVAGVAHEVRNPLFSISATVDALESELGEREEYAELTELLRSQVGRLRQLMRDLLDYGKPPVLRRAPVQPGEILRRAVRACAVLARERQVRIADEVPDDLPWLNVDGSRMEQVFQNLLANAIQHSPREGTVWASARLKPESASIEFRVEDEGTGIVPAEIPQLFEPFFSRRKGGTGLGLSVVQRIVETHGGRVTAANREGGGAVFTVRLPANVIEKAEALNG